MFAASFGKKYAKGTDIGPLSPSDARTALQMGEPLRKVIKSAGWSLACARVGKTTSLTGPEVACEVSQEDAPPIEWWNPPGEDDDRHF